MAQWLGQFSGHTHETKVEDSEELLRHAVKVFHAVDSNLERAKKAKVVHRLAKRLLTARLKLAKARIAAATDVQSGVALAKRENEIASLERKYAVVCEGGLEAILREFSVHDTPLV